MLRQAFFIYVNTASAAGVTIVNGYPTANAVELSGFEGINNQVVFVSEKEKAEDDLCLIYTQSIGNGYDLDKGKILNSNVDCDTSDPKGNW